MTFVQIARKYIMEKASEEMEENLCREIKAFNTHEAQEIRMPGGFLQAFEKQNICVETAIKSLDNLNDQIVQFIFTPRSSQFPANHEFTPKDRETLKSSLALMRRLLLDAQIKFRRMVEDNKKLAARIDTSIYAANKEVNALRVELADTNRRLGQISDVAANMDGLKALPNNDMIAWKGRGPDELERLRCDNSKMRQEITSLQRQLKDVLAANKMPASLLETKYNELKLELIQTKQEVNRAKESLQAMKADRKRLKSEKLDLLTQMKQLYSTLEDKEEELRDFIRNYEQRVRDSDDGIRQLAVEKEESEREKWEILRRARDSSERSVALQTELENKEQYIKKLLADLNEANEQLKLSGCKLRLTKSASDDSVLKASSLDGNTTSGDELPTYQSIVSSTPHQRPLSVNKLEEHTRHMNISCPPHMSKISLDNLAPPSQRASSSMSSDDINGEGIYVTIAGDHRPLDKRKKNPGTWSKLFGKTRSRRSLAISDPIMAEDLPEYLPKRLSILSHQNYQEKLSLLNKAKEISMSKWKAGHVLAWMEIDMNMSMYSKLCAENIKSGKVLLGLSDSELDSALGLSSALHRRKLRLAIEEYRDPTIIKFPKAAQIDHIWVARTWIPEVGLPQYSADFEAQLVDGRLLSVLTKKDLEKHLNVHRKFHQASILHSVELLRRINFDKETLLERRSQCEEYDCDPLVWTNHRLIRWLCSIDLDEYIGNLKESGVHGAVLVLEPTFNSEAFAAALGITPSKSYVRRHLAAELDILVRPARKRESERVALEAATNKAARRSAPSSLGRSFVRSYKGPNDKQEGDSSRGSGKRLSFRGSLGRALGRKARNEMTESPDAPKRRERSLDSCDRRTAHTSSSVQKTENIELQGTTV